MSDIFDEAMNSQLEPKVYATWGQCVASFFEAVWPKGQKYPERFDATIHKADDKFGRAEFSIIALPEMEARYPTEWKGNVSGYKKEDWILTVRPSIVACGVELRNMNDAWCKVERRPNGKFYMKKDANGVQTGEKGELSDFTFVKFFASEEECRADYLAYKSQFTRSSAGEVAPAPAAPAGVNNDLILKFTDAIVKKAAKDSGKDFALTVELVGQAIAKNAMLNGKIAPDSEAVLDMIAQACA